MPDSTTLSESEQVKQTLLGKPYPIYCYHCSNYMHHSEVLVPIRMYCDECFAVHWKGDKRLEDHERE